MYVETQRKLHTSCKLRLLAMPSFHIDRQETFNAQIYIWVMWTPQRSPVQLPTGEIGENITLRWLPINNCSRIPRLQDPSSCQNLQTDGNHLQK